MTSVNGRIIWDSDSEDDSEDESNHIPIPIHIPEPEICAICMHPLNTEPINIYDPDTNVYAYDTILVCTGFHAFHRGCIQNWCVKEPDCNCPICRRVINKDYIGIAPRHSVNQNVSRSSKHILKQYEYYEKERRHMIGGRRKTNKKRKTNKRKTNKKRRGTKKRR